MRYNNVSIEILVKGKPITEYPHNGQVYVEGRSGSTFEIAVQNHNSFRVDAVISVDGLATTDGKDAGPSSPGYLLEPYERIVIPGWRLDQASVAAFVFTGKGGGYASQTGRGHNTGVIGLLTFKEKERAHVVHTYGGAFPGLYPKGITRSAVRGIAISTTGDSDQPWWGATNSASANGFDAMMPMGAELGQNASYTARRTKLDESQRMWAEKAEMALNNLGTGFGQATDFATQSVSFERGDINGIITLFYDDARGLRARGIDLSRKSRSRANQQPNAFPGMSGCAPPPGWRG